MMKRISITIMLILPFLLCFTFINHSFAQQCDVINIPTLPKDYVDLPDCECTGATPTINSISDEIDPGGFIILYVDSGGFACPPYEWSVNSPYSIDSQSNNDLDTVTLSLPSGSCNHTNIIAIVIVADQCGASSQTQIRNSAGKWGGITYDCAKPSCYEEVLYNIVDDTRYFVGLCIHTPAYACTDPYPDCGSADTLCNEWLYDSKYSFAFPESVWGLKEDASTCVLCIDEYVHYYIESAGYQNWVCP